MSEYTDEMRQALAMLKAMTNEQRGRVLCWFCSACRRYVGPGDSCRCERDEAFARQFLCHGYAVAAGTKCPECGAPVPT
ncbi:MAG: hypothetical protein KF764_08495 [Labilithrix sp.]|nr:hypothetical protein [Labilithrix sp.]